MQPLAIPLADWLVIAPVLLPLLGACLLLTGLGRLLPSLVVAMIAALAAAAAALMLLVDVLHHGPQSMTMGRWLPPFGISFTADAAGAGFAFAATIVTTIVLLYGRDDAPPMAQRPAFNALVLLLLAGVSGAFLTGDLFNLYVWFEVMLIASFGLLVFSRTALSVDAAVKYGLLNFIGTSLFLLALGLLYGALGTLNMADIVRSAPAAPLATIVPIAALLLVAFSLKAAAFPLNTWLPASYHAPPAMVSALLGGLLTKVGVYALLRTFVLLLPGPGQALQPVLAAIAGATLLLAPLGAIAETNLRRAIGYMLIGGIGAAIVGIALPAAIGVSGTVAYIANAILTITALYLVAGLIERRTGQHDSRNMGGLYQSAPALSFMFLLLIGSVAGIPPFLGFWPKLLLLQAGIGGRGSPPADPVALALAVCLLLNAFLTVIAGARLWSHIFWRPLPAALHAPAETAITGRRDSTAFAATLLLTLFVFVAGIWPEPLLALGRAAASTLVDPHAYVAAVGLGSAP